MAAAAATAGPDHGTGPSPAQTTADGSRRRPLAHLARRRREWRRGVDQRVLWRRQFRNPRQVGALSGLTPTPHRSGDLIREQGIGKAGNRRVRAVMIQLGWAWLRFQPLSALSRW